MSNAPLDLSRLAIDRTPHGETTPMKPRPKRWITRYVVPIGILAGFVALLSAAAGQRWLPTKSVTVVPVVIKRGEFHEAGTTLFQSPGWIEPRPTAINVAALAAGVIEELLVIEGQYVRRNQPIARLISIDAELTVQQAENTLAIRDGEVNRATAELDAAMIRFANPVHLQVPLADAQSMLAKAQTEFAKLPFLLAAAESNEQYTRGSMQGKRAAGAGVSGRVVARAESEYAMASAELLELQSRRPNLEREIDALTDKVNALQRQLELLVEETWQVEEAKAKVQTAVAKRDEAKLQVRQAELALERNVVRAPMDGRVLSLVVVPGTRVMGLEAAAGQSSSTVIQMYDPNRLQVRADVRLEDVRTLTRGQPVEIETASTDGVIQGRVLQITSSANIQKNTLEVKVELIDAPPTVSPEMLVTASFLAPIVENRATEATEATRMYVPIQLVQSEGSVAFVWVVGADAVAQRCRVDLGNATADGLMEITSGLTVTDKLIVGGIDELKQDKPVTVIGDDQTLGMN